jgi:hypothetical protein
MIFVWILLLCVAFGAGWISGYACGWRHSP